MTRELGKKGQIGTYPLQIKMATPTRTVHIVRHCWKTFQSEYLMLLPIMTMFVELLHSPFFISDYSLGSRQSPVLCTGAVSVEDNTSLHPPLARCDPLVMRHEVWKDLMTSKAIPFILYTPLATTRPLLRKPAATHSLESANNSMDTYLPAVTVDPTVQPSKAVTKRKPSNAIHLSSVVKKRRRHMNRHKYRKRRKAQRFLRRRLGK